MRVGIDLGTTFSVAAVLNNQNEPEVILNREGKRLTPSVVLFEENGNVVVGEVAKDNALIYPRTEATMSMVLKDANMTYGDIDKILLVGGSSKIPFIRNRIKLISGIEPSIDINPDEAVALGAAIYAGTLGDIKQSDLKVSDVCSHSLNGQSYGKLPEKSEFHIN